MRIKKIPITFLLLLIFLLTATGCNTAQRPNMPETNKRPETMENNTNPGTDTGINTDQPRVQNDATVNDKATRDNIMPDQPDNATPTSEAGFALNQINKFELDIQLTSGDKVDMKYKKGPSNEESKVETVFDGKREKSEHEEASRQIEELLRKIPGASISKTNLIIDETLSALYIKREDVVEFDMEFVFESGERVHIELNDE